MPPPSKRTTTTRRRERHAPWKLARLRRFVEAHRLHPFATGDELQQLADSVALQPTQVAYWLANYRIRKWPLRPQEQDPQTAPLLGAQAPMPQVSSARPQPAPPLEAQLAPTSPPRLPTSPSSSPLPAPLLSANLAPILSPSARPQTQVLAAPLSQQMSLVPLQKEEPVLLAQMPPILSLRLPAQRAEPAPIPSAQLQLAPVLSPLMSSGSDHHHDFAFSSGSTSPVFSPLCGFVDSDCDLTQCPSSPEVFCALYNPFLEKDELEVSIGTSTA